MSKFIDITGHKYGRLTPVSYKGNGRWLCKCDCGNTSTVRGVLLRNGVVKSCGCYNKESTSKAVIIDLTGKRFGRLVVTGRHGSEKGRAAWLCKCDCGNEIVLKSINLLHYGTRSCGCLRKETAKRKMSQDLTGKQFGDLLVLGRDEKTGKWQCKCCRCGNTVLVKTSSLNNGRKDNCGCIDKASATMRKKHYEGIIAGKWSEYVRPLFSEKEYIDCNCLYGHVWDWECVKCGKHFSMHIHTTNFNPEYPSLPRCPDCYPFISGYSTKEKELAKFIGEIYNGKIIENDISLIHPLEIDILLPERKLAIEFDGMYWHNDENKPSGYHSEKTRLCSEHGYQLIHVFENEWDMKNEIVKDRIKSILGIAERRIYARKCSVSAISHAVSNEFLISNHLQGPDMSSLQYGLFYDDELVAVMTFGKPRFNKGYNWELIRFATALGTRVLGGASKLLSFFRKDHRGSIISYADRRYSTGRLYRSLGFTSTGVSKPNYWYFNTGHECLSRYECQKHKLKKLLGEGFDENLSESENMKVNGFCRIYDCGNIIFTMER